MEVSLITSVQGNRVRDVYKCSARESRATPASSWFFRPCEAEGVRPDLVAFEGSSRSIVACGRGALDGGMGYGMERCLAVRRNEIKSRVGVE